MVKKQKQDDVLKGLNPEQKKAVTHKNGPLLIIAGAGTGKTTVITNRIAHLITNENIRGDEILGLTFTNKAAEEMEERVDRLLPYGYVDLWISTFHGFAQRVLEAHAFDIGLPADIELIDQTGQWLLVRENFEKFDLDYYRPTNNPTKFIRAMLNHFSKLKDEEIAPDKYLAYAESLQMAGDDMESSKGKRQKEKGKNRGDDVDPSEVSRIAEIAGAYHAYQQLLLDNNKMDFGDLITYCLKLFRKRPNILKQYQEQFKHVLVDEFQDTNWAQYDLVKMLAKPQNNVTVVADDDQSIYRFRGASMSNVIQFSKDYKDAVAVSLIRNYRSGQAILDASYDFIQLNNPNRLEALRIHPDKGGVRKQRDDAQTPSNSLLAGGGGVSIDKKLKAQTKELSQVTHLRCKTGADEARIAAETINELKKHDHDATWNDFAVLVRANAQAAEFESALSAAGIPHQNYSAAGLYKTRLAADMLAFFDLLDDYHESRAVFRLLNLPFLDIAPEDIIKLTHHAYRKRVSLWDIVRAPQQCGITNETSLVEIIRLRRWIEEYAASAKQQKPSQILLDWLREGGYLEYLKSMPDADSLEQFRLLRSLWDHIRQIEQAIGDARVKDIKETIDQEKQSGEYGDLPQDFEAGPEQVKLLTVHGAKGLEFKYVFVTNLVDRRFPTIARRDAIVIPDELIHEVVPEGDFHLEEERRLFYVAMTRAKQGLFLLSAENYGGTQKKKLSRFLLELDEVHEPFSISEEALSGSMDDFLPKKMPRIKQNIDLPIPKKFSFTQLRIFDQDPFEYKLQFIYKIPLPGKYVFSYGSTIHNTLQKFFQMMMESSRTSQESLFQDASDVIARERSDRSNPVPQQNDDGIAASASTPPRNNQKVTLAQLLEIYRQSWIDDWYEDAQQKEKYFKQGKSRLKSFYENLETAEKAPEVKALERGFNLRVGEYTVLGRMDRVDQLEDGSVRIVDYKTGSPKKKLSIDDKRQLLMYQVAAEEVFGEKVAELVYHYVDAENAKERENQLSFIGSEDEKKEVKAWITDVIDRIHSSDFAPNPDAQFSDLADYFRDLGEAGEL